MYPPFYPSYGRAMKNKKGGYETGELENNPFASLLKGVERDALPAGDTPKTCAEASKGFGGVGDGSHSFRVGIERKGRGGKTVTFLVVKPWDDDWAKRQGKVWAKKLGCGFFVEDNQIVFQGDHRKRLSNLLDSFQK